MIIIIDVGASVLDNVHHGALPINGGVPVTLTLNEVRGFSDCSHVSGLAVDTLNRRNFAPHRKTTGLL